MAEKKIILTCDEMQKNLVVPESAMEAYKFALANAGIEMDEEAEADFVVRRNARSGWRDLNEAKAWFKKAYESIDEMLKHTFNVGSDEELPPYVKWSKQSYNSSFAEGAGADVAKLLVRKHLCTTEQLLDCITPSAMAKACGLTVEKMMDMFPDTVILAPKARTLTIK